MGLMLTVNGFRSLSVALSRELERGFSDSDGTFELLDVLALGESHFMTISFTWLQY